MTASPSLWTQPLLSDVFAPEMHDAEIAFYDQLAKRCKAANSRPRVLELGAGSGRILLSLDAEQYRLAGLDRQTQAIKELQSRANLLAKTIETIHAEIPNYRPVLSYDFCYCPVCMLNELSQDALQQTFQWIGEALPARGYFAAEMLANESEPPDFTIFNARFRIEERYSDMLSRRFNGGSAGSFCGQTFVEKQPNGTSSDFCFCYQIIDGASTVLWEHKDPFRVWRPRELEALFRLAASRQHFRLEWYEPYDLTQPKKDFLSTPRAMLVVHF